MKKLVNRGFTLVELMIVISIIGILAAVLYPSMTGYFERSRDTNRQGALRTISLALSQYNSDYSGYPKDSKCSAELYETDLKEYLKSDLRDPKGGNGAGGCGEATKGGYAYKALKVNSGDPAPGAAYALAANMEQWSNANFNGTKWTGLKTSSDDDLKVFLQKGTDTDKLKALANSQRYYVVTQ